MQTAWFGNANMLITKLVICQFIVWFFFSWKQNENNLFMQFKLCPQFCAIYILFTFIHDICLQILYYYEGAVPAHSSKC